MGGSGRPRHRRLSADERALWDEIAKSVNPAKRDPAPSSMPEETAPGAASKKPRVRARLPIEPPSPPPPSAPDLSHGKAPGMDRRTQQRLTRGKLDIEGRLDLHGHIQADAHRALTGFLQAAFNNGRRTVLVITGKGDRLAGRAGVLKEMVPRWLNEMPIRQWVTGFSYAAPKDGGEGALYIRVKRRRDPAG